MPDPTPPPGAAVDWTIDQRWGDYTSADHALWDRLYARQTRQLADRAHPSFLKGLATLDLSKSGIPDFAELSERLDAATGWSVVAVPGLVPDAVFYQHLANRRFVAGNFIRSADQIDYLEAPDVFHDVFGISKRPTFSTTCSGTSRCSVTRCLPITCRRTDKAGCAA